VCRHLAFLGSPRPIGELLFDAPHALVDQGREPHEMVVAKDNPDGWGVAWWPPGALEPRRYRTPTIMWEDTAFTASDEKAVAVVAAVRKASPGTTRNARNNAPFVADSRVGPLAFSLNGHAFHRSCEARVRAALPAGTQLEGDTDSEILFVLARRHVDAGRSPAEAIAAVHRAVAPGGDARVNLMLATADTIVATTWHHSLHVRAGDGTVTLASERLDPADPAWQRIPDASIVVADARGVRVSPLDPTGGTA
jgi:glutamine amidotransferase